MDTHSLQEQPFSKVRSFLFPIHTHELKKIIPMGLMMILIIFNFWVAHNAKDIIIISAPQSGAEVIHFLKVGVFVISIIFVMIYTWISNILTQRTIFYTIISLFMSFFMLFAFVIYPKQDIFHMSAEKICHLQSMHPHLKWIIPAIGYWGFSLFYIVSEMWSVLVITLLFWQFANQITTVEQSKRCYMVFGMFNGIGTILSGYFSLFYSKPKKGCTFNMTSYGETLQEMFLFFTGACLLIMALYYWINKYALNKEEHYHADDGTPTSEKNKIELSFFESFRYILRSRYVGYIAIMVIAYNISINFVEVTWKSQIKALHQTQLGIQGYLGNVTIYMGLITFLMAFIGLNFVRRVSWRRSALVTPILMGITGVAFFVLIIFDTTFSPLIAFLGTTPLLMSVWTGQTNNLLSKSCKFSFFNVTREMAYIPLDAELKVKGKAAVDIMGGRVGKLSGSLIQGFLLSFVTLGTQAAIAPYILILLLIVLALWVLAICGLHKEFMHVAYGKKIDEKTT
jgi:AAA family ATP:ADP antiporter